MILILTGLLAAAATAFARARGGIDPTAGWRDPCRPPVPEARA